MRSAHELEAMALMAAAGGSRAVATLSAMTMDLELPQVTLWRQYKKLMGHIVGWGWAAFPCPQCGAITGHWCGLGDNSTERGFNKVCPVRYRIWEACGRPDMQNFDVPPLLLAMIKATEEDKHGPDRPE